MDLDLLAVAIRDRLAKDAPEWGLSNLSSGLDGVRMVFEPLDRSRHGLQYGAGFDEDYFETYAERVGFLRAFDEMFDPIRAGLDTVTASEDRWPLAASSRRACSSSDRGPLP